MTFCKPCQDASIRRAVRSSAHWTDEITTQFICELIAFLRGTQLHWRRPQRLVTDRVLPVGQDPVREQREKEGEEAGKEGRRREGGSEREREGSLAEREGARTREGGREGEREGERERE